MSTTGVSTVRTRTGVVTWILHRLYKSQICLSCKLPLKANRHEKELRVNVEVK